MATTTTTSLGGGGEDRVLATAQQILKSLNTPKEVQQDMLLIFSHFDGRLSGLSNMIQDSSSSSNCNSELERFEAAEKVILQWDPSNPDEASRHHSSVSVLDAPDDAFEYFTAVDEMIQLMEQASVSESLVDRAENAIHLAMTRLEDEFRHVLIQNTVPLDADRLYGSIRRVSLSFACNDGEIDDEFESFGEVNDRGSCRFHERGASLDGDVSVDLIHPDAVMELRDIADRMIRSGYEKECLQVYCSVRRDALDECLLILGIEKLSIEEVQKIEWKALDEKMKRWVQAVKIGVRVLLTGEKKLCESVFCDCDELKEISFNEAAKGCVLQLLNFGEAVAIGRRSSEKLFRILDMYDALADVLPDLEVMISDEFVIGEAKGVLAGLAEAAKGTLVEFESNVKTETSKKPMQSGEVHPLTRYVMNYLRLLVDYSETLNSLLELGEEYSDGSQSIDHSGDHSQVKVTTPLGCRLILLIKSLESNLEEKSRLYEDNALQCIFLMNNILYVVHKVRDSELRGILGDDWIRKHRGLVRQYATSYLRAAWSKALNCLKDEGIGGHSSNASKVALKERFKNFNACFEDIYRIQSAWKVTDDQCREELRISISEKVLPAYRAFVGRFGSQLETGRHAGKYIKYSPEDLENYLSDLFEGSPSVLHHTRRKSS